LQSRSSASSIVLSRGVSGDDVTEEFVDLESQLRNLDATRTLYDSVARSEVRPRILFVSTGLNDSQVAYFEPAKWVARLRATATGANEILFLTNMGAGHGGDSGRLGFLDERAKAFAWILDKARSP